MVTRKKRLGEAVLTYPQSMFLSRNTKNDVYPCKPQFYYIKAGFKGVRVKIILTCFRDDYFVFFGLLISSSNPLYCKNLHLHYFL